MIRSLRKLDGRCHIAFDHGGMAFCEVLRLPVCPQDSSIAAALYGKVAAAIADGSFQLTNFFPSHPLAALIDGQAIDAGNPAFGPFALQGFRERRIEWRPSYIETMDVNLRRYLLPRFGSMAIAEIDKTAIIKFRLYLAEQAGLHDDTTLSPARVTTIMQTLHMIIEDATERMSLRSPWRNIRSLREKTPDIDPLSLEEIDRFLRHLRSDFRSYFELRFFTGLRSSEVNALVGKNVLLSAAKLDVRHALMKKRFVDLETRASRRTVDLPGRAVALLSRHLQLHAIGPEDLLFSGAPLNNAWMRTCIWRPALAAAGLAQRRPYQTRHTGATLWLSAGENPERVARQLGHATTEMLFKTYSRYLSDARERDGAAFERMLGQCRFGQRAHG